MRTQVKMQDKKGLSAVCGLFCPSCTIFIGTTEDPHRLKVIAERHRQRLEEWACYGCRSEQRCFYCEHTCYMMPCADEKGIAFCGECDEYPCGNLKQFQAERPHRIELWNAQERIGRVGYAQWFEEMLEHYACPQCKTINSVYDLICRNCGNDPSCTYVSRNKQTIIEYLKGLRECET